MCSIFEDLLDLKSPKDFDEDDYFCIITPDRAFAIAQELYRLEQGEKILLDLLRDDKSRFGDNTIYPRLTEFCRKSRREA